MIKELESAGFFIMFSFPTLYDSVSDLTPHPSNLISAQLQVMCGALA